MKQETFYIYKRIGKGKVQSLLFYLFRIFPINRRKIVFCCIEGTTGYSCNPKYIAKELIRRKENLELVWLVDDVSKRFPKEIKVVKNTLLNRAYHLTTARVWIDNSRKQLEVRKRKGQIYLQTWHAKLGFKPTCLDRGASFSKIAYLVSRHDSQMIDFVLSNSKWYDDSLKRGMLYKGRTLRFGSPRCDVLINDAARMHRRIRKRYGLSQDARIVMYAPTFRGGSQSIDRAVRFDDGALDYRALTAALEERFGGSWYVMLRLHPQLVARQVENTVKDDRLIDVSRADDMYEILAGCDAFITDYSSAAFDAAVMKIPVFLYCSDYEDYEKERGSLLWDLKTLPFGFAKENAELRESILGFDEREYRIRLQDFFHGVELKEDGRASARTADFILNRRRHGKPLSIRDQ